MKFPSSDTTTVLATPRKQCRKASLQRSPVFGALGPVSERDYTIPQAQRRQRIAARHCVAICHREKDKVSGLRRQIDIIHKQGVNARLAECDDRVGGRADDWLAVIERRIDDERHAGSRKETGYELVKVRI
jgi:hypothetical protein